MGKKTKRTRKSSSSQDDDNIVSDSDNSHGTAPSLGPFSTPGTSADDDGSNRKAPALRSVPEQNVEETTDNLQCEDPYEDIYEEEEEDDEYEDVYESSGDEDEDYMEAMATGNDEGAAKASSSSSSKKPTTTTTEQKAPPSISMNHGDNQPAQVKSWNPFSGNPSGSPLEMDETAYKMHHALTPEWPSLTLDIIPDRYLGDHRTRFPHTVTMVVGSQADDGRKNKLSVLRMSDLARIPGSGREKTEKELDDEMLGEEWKHEKQEEEESDAEDDSDSENEEEEEELDPVLEHYSFPHNCGGINRIRVCPHNSDIVSVWSDSGVVSLYDVGGALDVLDRSSLGASSSSSSNNNNKDDAMKQQQQQQQQLSVRKMRKDPFFTYSGHSTEGYALDWSRVTPGRLATADCEGNIHIWNASHPVIQTDIVAKYKKSSPWGNSSFTIQPTYSAHGDNLDNPSVEDLQWSPTEATVLASAECGGYVRVYDVRCPGKAMISNKIHSNGADVNVISWNRLVGNLLATGGDDGEYRG